MTAPAPVPENPAPPKWIAPWLALLAPLYIISPLSLLALPYLRKLPKPALYVLGFYALSQQIPALFTPEPLLASVLALVRTLLMFGLIGVGVALGDSQRLKPFVIGLVVVFLTAAGYSAFGGLDILINRLTHPYMTPITLGLAGALGIWLALFLKGTLIWRVPVGLASLGILLLSGSRGALAATFVGCIAGLLAKQGYKTIIALFLGATILVAGFYSGNRLGLTAITRLSNSDTTGRDIIWSNTLTIIQAYPMSGVGSYRLGQYLAPTSGQCTLFLDTQGKSAACPNWIEALGKPWLIAHNITLQQLAESGPLGLLGLFQLLGAAIIAVYRTKSSLSLAILSGLLIATINDNTLLVPSPFFGELFWLVVGVQLKYLQELSWRAGIMTTGIVFVLSLPALFSTINWPARHPSASISFLNAPTEIKSTQNYSIAVQFSLPPGDYRANLNACAAYCTSLNNIAFKTTQQNSPILIISGDLFPLSSQRVEIELLGANRSVGFLPLGFRSWTVRVNK